MRRSLPLLSLAALLACDGGGTGDGARLTATPGVVDFGALAVGSVARREVVLENASDAAVVIARVDLDPALHDELRVEGLPSRLAAGAKRTIELIAAPRLAGSLDSAARIVTAEGAPLDIAVRGRAIGDALELQPQRLDFGLVPIGESRTATLTVVHRGPDPLMITTFVIEGSQAYRLADPGPRALVPGQRLELAVVFTPDVPGSADARLTLGSEGRPFGPVILDGQGIGAGLDLEPRQIDFGPVLLGETRSKRVRVASSARAPIEARITAEGDLGAFDGLDALIARPIALEAGGTLFVDLRYAPEVAGHARVELFVSIDGAPPVPLGLVIGSGVALPERPLVAEPAELDFGPATIGATTRRSLWLVNTAPVAKVVTATRTVIGPLALDAEVPLSQVVPAGDRHRFDVRLTPAELGPGTGSIHVAGTTIPVRWEGVARPVAAIDAPAAVDLGLGAGPRVIEIDSVGTAPVTISATVGAPFSVLAPASLGPGERGALRIDAPTPRAPARGVVRLEGGEQPVEIAVSVGSARTGSQDFEACAEWEGPGQLELHAIPPFRALRDAPFVVSDCQPEIVLPTENGTASWRLRSSAPNVRCISGWLGDGSASPILIVLTAPAALEGARTATVTLRAGSDVRGRSRPIGPGMRWDVAIAGDGRDPAFLDAALVPAFPERCY